MLGELGRRNALETLQVGLPMGHVIAPALGGGVHEDEFLVVHGDKVGTARAVRPALPQDLDAPVPQRRSRGLPRVTSRRCSFPWLSASSCWGPPLGAPFEAGGGLGRPIHYHADRLNRSLA